MATVVPQDSHDEELPFCAAVSKLTGDFVDLSQLAKTIDHGDQDWHIRGLDFGSNFSVNICKPVVRPPPDQYSQVATPQNVGAYYIDANGRAQSLGEASAKPYFRGRNLVLQYDNGSPCLDRDGRETPFRKSSIFSFRCDRDLLLSSPPSKAAVLTYAASANECSFFFEVRAVQACPSVDTTQGINPIIIFLVFIMVALLVYSSSTVLRLPSMIVAKLLGKQPLKPQPFDVFRRKEDV